MRLRFLALGLLASVSLEAQAPKGSVFLSAGAVADSQAAIQTLSAQIKKEPSNAALWYRLGMIAWALDARGKAPNAPSTLAANNFARMADSALHVATEYAPSNARYLLALGQFTLATGNIAMRTVAVTRLNKAYDIAKKYPTDSLTRSETAIEVGRKEWRRYDSYKDRRMQASAIPMERSISDAMHPLAKAEGMLQYLAGGGMSSTPESEQAAAMMYAGGGASGSLKRVQDLLKQTTTALPSDLNGAIEYEKASELFREAYAFAPRNDRAFRHVAMSLADSSRWIELDNFSKSHLRRFPWDPHAWLTLGLARHRRKDSKGAAAAYDSAFAYLDPLERGFMDRIERVMRPDDSLRLAKAGPATRNATTDMYWRFADPLWSRDGNETRVEFLARVTYAELRWTVDELSVHGADTDRGDTYIRYGPPDITAVLQPKASSDGQDVITFWLYKSGLMFTFSGMSTFGTAVTPLMDRAMADGIKDMQPVRWDNINEVQVDSMPLQVARFRGGRDSVDVFVAARPPFAAISGASEVREPISGLFWMLKDGATISYRDSSSIKDANVHTWTARVAPGAYVYRAEASATGAARAARVTSTLVAGNDSTTGFSLNGFGMSDVLLTSSSDVPSGAVRWSSLHAVAITGPVPSKSTVNVMWENYDLGQKDGSAQYTITLSLVRERSAAGRIAASVIGALASVAQIDQQSDRITMKFDRSQPHSAAFADQIQVSLGETPYGIYNLTVEVADKVTGRSTKRSTQLLIQR